jgi:peptidoglycan/LPS O-acetylase OafA/YrhL
MPFHFISNYFSRQVYAYPLLDKVNFSFILSGYLIGTTLIRSYNRDDFNFQMVRNFWVRRWIRTIPAYFLIITAMVALRYTFTHVGFEFPWRYYLFIQNLYVSRALIRVFFPEGWSLSVEEWFYFLVPAFVFIGNVLLSKVLSKKQLILSIIISIVAVSTYLRVHRAMNTPELDIDKWKSLSE